MIIFDPTNMSKKDKHKQDSRIYYYLHKQKVLDRIHKNYNPKKASEQYKKSKDNLCIDCGVKIDRRSKRCNPCFAKIKKITMLGKKYPGQTRSLGWRKKVSEATTGKNHWNWKGGRVKINKSRISSQEWRRRSKECYKRDGYRCQICGIFGIILNAHHIISWRISHNDSLDNLITVCVKCHHKIEQNSI